MDNIRGIANATDNGKVASYHHGDLRAALIRAARTALETTPPETIQLKALAQQLGVSQPAPYRHFEGRDALMAAVAADGFDRLLAALLVISYDSPDDLRLERLCLAYIAFALDNLGVYRLMFTRTMLGSATVGRGNSSDASFKVLIAEVERRVGNEPAPIVATTIWSTLHGAVGLHAEGLLPSQLQYIATVNNLVIEMISAIASKYESCR